MERFPIWRLIDAERARTHPPRFLLGNGPARLAGSFLCPCGCYDDSVLTCFRRRLGAAFFFGTPFGLALGRAKCEQAPSLKFCALRAKEPASLSQNCAASSVTSGVIHPQWSLRNQIRPDRSLIRSRRNFNWRLGVSAIAAKPWSVCLVAMH